MLLALGRMSDMEVGPGSSAAGGTDCAGGWLGLEGAELELARGGERSGLGDAVLTWAGPVSLDAGLGWEDDVGVEL